MVTPRRMIENYSRSRDFFESRSDKVRLDFNEYVPHINRKVFNQIIEKINPETFSMYPETNKAYQSLSTYLCRAVDNILLTSGADQAIFLIFNTFCEAGDRVGILEPNFSMYHHYARVIGCEVVKCYYDEIMWNIDLESIYRLIRSNCKMIVITTPNSYTGTTICKDDLNIIVDECYHAGILVLIDEVYFDFSNEDCSDFVDRYDNVICLRSFSKSVGLAGIRAGYLLSNSSIIEYIYRASFGVEINGIAVKAIEYLCGNPEIYNSLVNEIIDSKNYLIKELIGLGFHIRETETNFIPIKPKDKYSLVSYLKTNNVRIRKYPEILTFKDYISLTVGSMEMSESVVKIFKQYGNEKNEI